MNFVQRIEECLRDLAVEARKKHPGVKESAEKATMKLRTLQTEYAAAVRKATSKGETHPTTSLFRSHEILHPFVLAANYPDASCKLLDTAFRGMRLLMEADAIIPTDGINIIRVWMIQAQVGVSYYQKHFSGELGTRVTKEPGNSSVGSGSNTASSGWFSWSASRDVADSSKQVNHAVSSSTGKAGSSSVSGNETDKRALDILSSLVQLLELLRKTPEYFVEELWTNAVALACVWLVSLPARHKVKAAAKSTVTQLLALLFETGDKDIRAATWNDLIKLSAKDAAEKRLAGAFRLCKLSSGGASQSVTPPNREFAIELMAEVWPAYQPAEHVVLSTIQTTSSLMEENSRDAGLEQYLRVSQWIYVLLKTQASKNSVECQHLFLMLVKQVSVATESCREQHDFEDGFVLTEEEATKVAKSSDDSLAPCVFPPNSLWKAAVSLESIYRLLDLEACECSALFQDADTLLQLSEALSDFGTIGSSCRGHIQSIFRFTIEESGARNVFKPSITRKVEQILLVGSEPASIDDANVSSSSPSQSKAISTILGESIWLAFESLLMLLDNVQSADIPSALSEGLFASSLALLQHFLKRFPGSERLVQSSLSGYSSLAVIFLPGKDQAIQRKALLTSLCKLSLPSWGKHDASCRLTDQHVLSLVSLLHIVHVNRQYVLSEWDLILRTLEELSILSIASPLVSDEVYHKSLALSQVFQRMPAFSTCLPADSLSLMVEAITDIARILMQDHDVIVGSDTILRDRNQHKGQSEASSKSKSSAKGGISGKLVSMGVRAIYGSNSEDDDSAVNHQPLRDRTKSIFYEDYRQDFAKRMASSNTQVRVSSVESLPFVLILLADIAISNSYRYRECGDKLSEQISVLASSAPAIRPFAMDIMAMLTMSHLTGRDDASPASFVGPGKIVFEDPTPSQLLAVEKVPSTGMTPHKNGEETRVSQAELLSPLCKSMKQTTSVEVAESSLETVHSILEGSGHNFRGEAWKFVADALASLSGDPDYSIDRTSDNWTKCCLSAFRCLKFIVDDFIDQIQEDDQAVECRRALLDCCASFCRSRHDLNTALTSIGLLWTISDQDDSTSSVRQAMSRLMLLAENDRQEVRNAAVNTFFSCIVGRGAAFNDDQWRVCFEKDVFGLYDVVVAKTDAVSIRSPKLSEKRTRYQLPTHHSRSSSTKLWMTTQVLLIRGILRICRTFFDKLLPDADAIRASSADEPPWFQDVWVKVLDVAFDASNDAGDRDTLDLHQSGVELLVACAQLSSKDGIHAAIAIEPLRAGTHMEVVNGALRSVRDMKATVSMDRERDNLVESFRASLFLEAFEGVESVVECFQQREADDVQLQILHRLASSLAGLYECGKYYEFGRKESIEDVAPKFEARFVQTVLSVVKLSTVDPQANFLNQAQRSCLELLRALCANNSHEGFKQSILLAGRSIFCRKDVETNGADEGPQPAVSFEVSVMLAKVVGEDNVSNESKMYCLYKVMRLFRRAREDDLLQGTPTYYKRMVPVVLEGLESCRILSVNEEFTERCEAVWIELRGLLVYLLSPVTLERTHLKIARIGEVREIVESAFEQRIPRFSRELFDVLLGAADGLVLAFDANVALASTHTDSERGTKAEQHAREILELFQSCFRALCTTGSTEVGLSELTMNVLDTGHSPAREDLTVAVCDILSGEGNSPVFLSSILPSVARLLLADSLRVKELATNIIALVDLPGLVTSLQGRVTVAEQRASKAEATSHRLQTENDRLKREIVALESSL